MKSRLLTTLAALALLALSANFAFAVPTTLIKQGSSWEYQTLTTDLNSNWAIAGLGSVDWDNGQWQTGNAAFGNSKSTLPYSTFWRDNTDLALQKTFNIATGPIDGNLTLNIASDNGFIVFINGTEVARDNREGYTFYWEYTLSLLNTPFIAPGANLIQVLAEDHGGKTFFDLKLTGDVPPVPEPGTILLLGSGLVGLAFLRRKK